MGSEAFLSKANTQFALDLFKKFSKEDRNKNIFYSPFSISAALAMVRLGAAGNTRTQISETLYFEERAAPPPCEDNPQASMYTDRPYPMQSQMLTRMQVRSQIQVSSRMPDYLKKCRKSQEDKDSVDAKFGQLLEELNKPDALYALSVANKLYGEQTYTFKEDFVSDTKKHYNAPFETLDFSSNPDASRIHINNWVEEETKGKITDLLSSEAIGSSTILVLVNAIHFKGKWQAQFKEEFTTDDEFRLNKTDKKPVKMMKQKSSFHIRSIEEVNIKVLEMPYQGMDLSMIIMLPNDIEDDSTGLEKLEGVLTYDKFEEWTARDQMNQEEVEVRLPRFKMQESYDLKDVLIAMGIVDAFDVSKSDFSVMTEANNLVLSKAVHKANLEVNEEGTEAVAATAVVLVERAALIPERFEANRPFLFFIKHIPSNSVLFAGRFCSPE